MARRRTWTWDQTLVAFRLYCHTPFGKLHQRNPEIIALARLLDRTPSAVGMKACNFASLDPMHQQRGVKGLRNRGQLEQQVWERFVADSEGVAAEAEEAHEQLVNTSRATGTEEVEPPEGPTEQTQSVRVRRVQGFFRSAVLASYGYRCALTGLGIPALVNASHIIPWSASPDRRADPRNGICFNALHDRAFDRGLITLDDDLTVIVSPALERSKAVGDLSAALLGYAGQSIRVPERFVPDQSFLAYHREHVFQTVCEVNGPEMNNG